MPIESTSSSICLRRKKRFTDLRSVESCKIFFTAQSKNVFAIVRCLFVVCCANSRQDSVWTLPDVAHQLINLYLTPCTTRVNASGWVSGAARTRMKLYNFWLRLNSIETLFETIDSSPGMLDFIQHLKQDLRSYYLSFASVAKHLPRLFATLANDKITLKCVQDCQI